MRTLLRTVRWGAALLGLTFVLAVLAGPAAAHAALESTEPANGSTVASLDRVVLHFAEEVEAEGSHLVIHDAREAEPLFPVRYGDDHRTLVVDVPKVRDGAYTVAWHVLALDGDPVTGELGVTIASGAAATGAPAVADVPSTPGHAHGASTVPAAAARMLVDLALTTLVGGLAFVALVWPGAADLPGTRRVLLASTLTAAVATAALAVVQRDTAAVDWGELLRLRIGHIAVARLVLLALVAIPVAAVARRGSAVVRTTWWRGAAAALSLGLLETVVLAGHAGRALGLDATARLVHTIGLSLWLGGLVVLFVVVLPRRRKAELRIVLPRFSALATAAMGILVLAGLLLSADLLGSAGALPSTTYGRILLAKVAVVTVLIAAAGRSRSLVRRRLDRGVAPIATWVGTELALVAAVFALTALLVSHAPPA